MCFGFSCICVLHFIWQPRMVIAIWRRARVVWKMMSRLDGRSQNGYLYIMGFWPSHTIITHVFFPKKRGFHMIHMISWDLTTINGDRPKKETGIQAWSRSTDSVTAGIDLQYLQAMVLWKIWKVRESHGDWRSFYGIFLVFMNFPTWAASEALYQSTEGWRWSTFSQGVQADQAARCVAKGPMDLL